MHEQQNGKLSKRERKALKREERFAVRARESRGFALRRMAKRGIMAAGAVAVFGSGALFLTSLPEVPESAVLSRNGLHWHADLAVVVHGEPLDIPGNIGLGTVHNPVHTHEADGVIHMEFGGLVRERDITVGRFFNIWGEEFNSERILEYRNGSEGTVRFFVNGTAHEAFGDYVMQDGDTIEIRYE